MNQKKIEQLEKEIRDYFYNPPMGERTYSDKDPKEFVSIFWDIHVKPVIEQSKLMAKKYEANLEVLWLSAILHDIVRIEDIEPHDELGAKKAKLILSEKGFDKKTIDQVCKAILTHSCKKYPPKTLEQKILATADAVAHFTTPFYLWALKYFASRFPKPRLMP